MRASRCTLMILLAWMAAMASAWAEELSIVGAWKLVSYAREDVASGETTTPWGANPAGYLMYLPDGHMSAVLTSERRSTVAAGDERQVAQLFLSMSAYAGTYSVAGNKVIHHVEVAWVPGWVGSDQPREASMDGEFLSIRTQPMRHRLDGQEYIYILRWKRAK